MLEPDSLRVEVGTKSASPGLTVFDVVHVPPTYDYGRQYDVGSERGGLDEKLAALNARLTVLETQKSIFGSFGESLRASPLDNSTNGSSPVGTLEAFLDVFSTRHSAIYEETRSLETEKSSVQERMSEIQRKDNSEQEAWRAARLEFPSFYWLRRLDLPNWSCLVVSSRLFCSEEYEFVLMQYVVVRRASWSSPYDVRAELTSTSAESKTSKGPTITLQYRANIQQSTGEN